MFVILIFILSEYTQLTEDSISPNRKRPYKYGAIAILISIVLSSSAIITLGISIIYSIDLVCVAGTLFLVQLLILLGTAIAITHDILVNR